MPELSTISGRLDDSIPRKHHVYFHTFAGMMDPSINPYEDFNLSEDPAERLRRVEEFYCTYAVKLRERNLSSCARISNQWKEAVEKVQSQADDWRNRYRILQAIVLGLAILFIVGSLTNPIS